MEPIREIKVHTTRWEIFIVKNVVVTGGASGIGQAVAAWLRKDGLAVATIDLKPAESDDAAFAADMTDRAQVDDALAEIQVYEFKAELQCNWKIFVDSFAESYHGPYLHASTFGNLTAEPKAALDAPNPFTDALAYQLKGPHRMFSFAGEPSRKTPYSKPIECVMEASAAGPWNKRTDRAPMPPGLNPTRAEKYGFDSFQFFPNFVLIFGASGFTTHTHWPTGPHSHIFEVEMFYQPPTTHKERLGQELTVTFLNDIILEDASPCEGMQAMLNRRRPQGISHERRRNPVTPSAQGGGRLRAGRRGEAGVQHNECVYYRNSSRSLNTWCPSGPSRTDTSAM